MKGGNTLINIYEKCPTYKGKVITLRQTSMEDADERIVSLTQNGYKALNRKFIIYDDYFVSGK